MKDGNTNYISRYYGDILHIYIPTFTRNIYYLNTDSTDIYKKILTKQLGIKDFGTFNHNAVGNFSVYEQNNTPVGIIRCLKRNIPELAHECLHATFWIMEDVGMELNRGSEEAYCYTQMMLMSEILKRR